MLFGHDGQAGEKKRQPVLAFYQENETGQQKGSRYGVELPENPRFVPGRRVQ